MESVLFSGLFDLPWWGLVVVTLVLTHITIVGVTIFLHRHQAHHALDLHPAVSHFFRLWLWLTTGMVTKEWAAVHRKHHAKCDTPEDPHSPQILGLNRVLWGGVFLYVKEANRPDTIERYGHGTPDDWLERNLYSRFTRLGLTPDGCHRYRLVRHRSGRADPCDTNRLDSVLGGRRDQRHRSLLGLSPLVHARREHQHRAMGHSDRRRGAAQQPPRLPDVGQALSNKWYEFDIGWLYIRMLEALGLAKVKHVAPTPHFATPKPAVDPDTLQAIIRCRYDVLAKYAQSLKRTYAEELGQAAPALAAGGARAARPSSRGWIVTRRCCTTPSAHGSPKCCRSRTRCRPCTRCAATWPRYGAAPRPRASNSSSNCRTGAGARRRAGSGRWSSSRSACALTPEPAAPAEAVRRGSMR